MRNLVKTYTFTAGTRQITVTGDAFDVQDIRLIVNETQNKIIASSMKKANILSVTDNVITFSDTLPVLADGDVLTIEIDHGVPQALALAKVMDDGLAEIVEAVNLRGGNATVQDSYHTIATKIGTALLPTVTVGALPSWSSLWHDLFAVMAAVYDPTYPYMYSLLLVRETPQDVLNSLSDGEVIVQGGQDTEGKTTRWVVFKRSTHAFSATYNINYRPYLIGCALYNAEMMNVSFYGSKLAFYLYNNDFNLPTITFNGNQFRETSVAYINTPLVDEIIFAESGYQFVESGLSHITLNSRQKTIIKDNTGYIFNNCKSLALIEFPTKLEELGTGYSLFQGCLYLNTFKLPSTLKKLRLRDNSFTSCTTLEKIIFPLNMEEITTGVNTFYQCSSLKSVILPNSLKYINLGFYTFQGLSMLQYIYIPNATVFFTYPSLNNFTNSNLLTVIELGVNWKWTISLNTANSLTRDCLLAIFVSLVDKRKDGANPSTCSTINGSKIVTFTNGNCLAVFVSNAYIQHTITIGATTYTIASVDSDNQVTLTANASATVTNSAYNMNRTLALGATLYAKVSDSLALPNAKGWTITG